MISIIVAASDNNGIGLNNKLLWHLPNDLKFFKNTTWALPVIMGRNTYESLGGKPLNGRTNIVLTANKSYTTNGAIIVNTVAQALAEAEKTNCNEIMIAGGASVYKQFLPLAHKVYLTRVHTTVEADTFFEPLDTMIWQLQASQQFTKDEKHAYDYSFENYVLKSMK